MLFRSIFLRSAGCTKGLRIEILGAHHQTFRGGCPKSVASWFAPNFRNCCTAFVKPFKSLLCVALTPLSQARPIAGARKADTNAFGEDRVLDVSEFDVETFEIEEFGEKLQPASSVQMRKIDVNRFLFKPLFYLF